jgi:hypothetical protein
MAECIEHSLMGENAVGEREFRDQIGQILGHDSPLLWRFRQLPANPLRH